MATQQYFLIFSLSLRYEEKEKTFLLSFLLLFTAIFHINVSLKIIVMKSMFYSLTPADSQLR